jgi:hypothetical protein
LYALADDAAQDTSHGETLTQSKIVEIRAHAAVRVGKRCAHVAEGNGECRGGRRGVARSDDMSGNLSGGRKLSGRVDGEGESGQACTYAHANIAG